MFEHFHPFVCVDGGLELKRPKFKLLSETEFDEGVTAISTE